MFLATDPLLLQHNACTNSHSLEEQGKADLQVLAIIFDKPLAERWKTGTGNSVHYKKRQEKKPRNHRPVSLYFHPRKTLKQMSEQIITPENTGDISSSQ